MDAHLNDDYLDLYARQTLQQTAVAHYGGSRSPDLLPWGTVANPDAAGLATPAAMLQDPGVGLVPGVDNFLYTRVRNPAGQETRGRLYLAAAAPAYLCWPDTLTPVPTCAGKAWADIKVPTGGVGVALDGFRYCPTSTGDSIAAWAYTLADPVTLPTLNDVNALLAFLHDTPSYVQRSVAFGLDADSYRYQAPYDQRGVAAAMAFELMWTDCPLGWTLELQPCDGGDDVAIAPFQVTMAGGSVLVQRNLAAGFRSTLALSIESGGIAPAATTRIELRISLQTDRAAAAPDALRLFPLGGHLWCSQPGAL